MGHLDNHTNLRKKYFRYPHDSIDTIKVTLKLGNSYLNYYCKKIQEPFFVNCDQEDRMMAANEATEEGKLVVMHKPIEFHFDVDENLNYELTEVRVRIYLGQNAEDSADVPPHFYGELVKTQEGIDLLK